jgi:SAM-dependent methyltransferase
MSFDSAQFKRLERKGYNRIGARYLAAAGSRGELAAALLAAAGLAPGQRVLDLASGPGLLAHMAQQVVGATASPSPATSAKASSPAVPIWHASPPMAKRCPLPTAVSSAWYVGSA